MQSALHLKQPQRDATPRAPRPRHWGRRGAHALAIAVGWALFFWGWQRVLGRGADFGELQLLMLGAAIVVPVVTVSWILHNRGIHRRKGPRRSVPEATLDYRVDFNGREVVADFRALSQARRVEVVIEGAFKRYVESVVPEAVSELSFAKPASRPPGETAAPARTGAPDLAAPAKAGSDSSTSAAS